MPAWVDIELDKVRKIRFQHNDCADIEQATGKSFAELLNGSQFHGTRLLLAYGLRWMDRTMTPQRAGQLIQEHWIDKGKTFDDLGAVLIEALQASGMLPKQDTPPEGNEQPGATTT